MKASWSRLPRSWLSIARIPRTRRWKPRRWMNTNWKITIWSLRYVEPQCNKILCWSYFMTFPWGRCLFVCFFVYYKCRQCALPLALTWGLWEWSRSWWLCLGFRLRSNKHQRIAVSFCAQKQIACLWNTVCLLWGEENSRWTCQGGQLLSMFLRLFQQQSLSPEKKEWRKRDRGWHEASAFPCTFLLLDNTQCVPPLATYSPSEGER